MMKRGRGSFKKELGSPGSSSGPAGIASSDSGTGTSTGRKWIQVPKSSVKDLPQQEGTVSLLDTQALRLVDKSTNPTGAVGVMKYDSATYCFSASCPSCKIPLTKAKALPPNDETNNAAPRIACDFCKSTYNLKTGEKLKSQQGGGIFGGIAKAVMSTQESGPLPIYQLGEKNGKILFSMD